MQVPPGAGGAEEGPSVPRGYRGVHDQNAICAARSVQVNPSRIARRALGRGRGRAVRLGLRQQLRIACQTVWRDGGDCRAGIERRTVELAPFDGGERNQPYPPALDDRDCLPCRHESRRERIVDGKHSAGRVQVKGPKRAGLPKRDELRESHGKRMLWGARDEGSLWARCCQRQACGMGGGSV